jgi:hypothetical protein
MVSATRRYRHAVPLVRGWLLVARLPPRLSGSELRYRRAYCYSGRPTLLGQPARTILATASTWLTLSELAWSTTL